jgi:hypothetical protein
MLAFSVNPSLADFKIYSIIPKHTIEKDYFFEEKEIYIVSFLLKILKTFNDFKPGM